MTTPPETSASRAWRGRLAAAVVALASCLPVAGHAAELRVLSAGAVEPGLRPALAAFTRESGHAVVLVFAAAPELQRRLADAAPGSPSVADVVIVPDTVRDQLGVATSTAGREQAPIGSVGVGVAVRSGAEAPDVTSDEALKQALLGADAVVYNRASSGLYIEAMLRRLGVAEAVEAKSVRFGDGASVLRRLAEGTAPREFGFAQLTEIALFRDQGVRLVGPLPADLQNTTRYVALAWPPGVSSGSAAGPEVAAATAALVRYLQGDEARRFFRNAGIETPR